MVEVPILEYLLEEMTERSMPNIVEKSSKPQFLGFLTCDEPCVKESLSYLPGNMHHPKAVVEPCVFRAGVCEVGCRELTYPAEALKLGCVDYVYFGLV